MAQYEKEHHLIYHGDAVKILSQSIPDASVDLIFLDPPSSYRKKIFS